MVSVTRDRTLGALRDLRLVPLVTLTHASQSEALGAALAAAGAGCVEITLRSDAGLDGIRTLAGRGDLLVGAGTVFSPDDVDQVVDAGAAFIVSPGIDPAVVERAQERGVAVLPGVATATEAQLAHRLGLDAVKFFPAEPSGGVTMIDALAAPFPGMSFMPSGGVSASTVRRYLAARAVMAVSGSWMLDTAHLAAGDVEAMTATLRGARLDADVQAA